MSNTLERLRSLQAQNQPPTARANPLQGSSGGSPTGTLTDRLSATQRSAISEPVRECWTKDDGAPNLDKMQAMLVVTIDGEGVARRVEIAPEDAGRMSDPRFRAFAERAVLNPRCSNLPVPHALISGVRTTFKFRFTFP